MTEEEKQQAINYAIALGYSREDAENMDVERLKRQMQSIAEDCARWGCD